MHAREQQVPLDVVLGNPRPKSYHVSEYAGIILDRLYAAHDLARERLKRSAERAKRNYDPRVRPKQ